MLTGILLAAPSARAAPSGRTIDVIEVSKHLDPIEADFVERSLARAEGADAEVLVIQLDCPGAFLDRADLEVLAFRISHARVPVTVWVGPSNARAYGGATWLLEAAAVSGMAPGTRTGKAPDGPPGSPLRTPKSLSAAEARARGAIDVVAPTLGEFIVGLDGVEAGGRTLSTARVVDQNGAPRREAAGDVRFAKLGLVDRLLHAAAGPQMAYLLLMVGLALIVFEFFTAGVGLAGGVGAAALVLASYGLAVLPTSALGLVLIGVGLAGFSIDVQSGAPRAWTVIGTVALLVGSWQLFPGEAALPWYTVLAIVLGTALLMVAGMPSMIRARFSTPTIGREWMIGRMGEATTGIAPEGTVRLEGAVWRARTNRATPIASGDPIRVVAVDGLLLEVEPETGGAKDAGH